MTNKKTVAVVVLFAVVAALLTFARHPQMLMPHMVSGTITYPGGMPGSAGLSGAIKYDDETATYENTGMGMMEGEAVRGKRMPLGDVYNPTSSFMLPRPYYEEGLNIEQRVYDHSAYQGLVVSNVSEYMRQVKEYVLSNGGKIMHVSQYTTDDIQYAYLDARIPAEKFDEATALFASRAKKVMTETLNTQDVTGQQKSLADQLTDLEEKKAVKATELSSAPTQAERQRIQAEIDQINEMIKLLKDSQDQFAEDSKYATIAVTVADSERFFNPESGISIQDQLRSAFKSLQATSKVLGIFFIWVAVYAVIWLPIILATRWLWGKLYPTADKK
jgi:hypothetical protein